MSINMKLEIRYYILLLYFYILKFEDFNIYLLIIQLLE